MATMQVPGAEPANQDELHSGCWAEKGSDRILVKDVPESGNVLFVLFTGQGQKSLSRPVADFQHDYSDAGWLWHDKTPFKAA